MSRLPRAAMVSAILVLAAFAQASPPAAPGKLQPPRNTVITMRDLARAGTLFSWRSQGTTRYVFQLARDAEFKEKAVDTSRQEESIEVKGLAEGTYYWRVAGVSETGERGPFGEAWKFTLRQARPEGPGPRRD